MSLVARPRPPRHQSFRRIFIARWKAPRGHFARLTTLTSAAYSAPRPTAVEALCIRASNCCANPLAARAGRRIKPFKAFVFIYRQNFSSPHPRLGRPDHFGCHRITFRHLSTEGLMNSPTISRRSRLDRAKICCATTTAPWPRWPTVAVRDIHYSAGCSSEEPRHPHAYRMQKPQRRQQHLSCDGLRRLLVFLRNTATGRRQKRGMRLSRDAIATTLN